MLYLFPQALVNDDDNMNFTSFEGKKVNQEEILDLAETLPFFSKKRAIVFDNTELGKKCDEVFLKRLGELPDTTIRIFIEKGIESLLSAFASKVHVCTGNAKS
jgi:DNA polymerase-3 subunit delta